MNLRLQHTLYRRMQKRIEKRTEIRKNKNRDGALSLLRWLVITSLQSQ
ncbi:hypothetical protein Gp_13 [Bacillus phage vB_Bacillus_1020A]|nr:hypothetical protein Gp_13 [Bacillus phage vB_Bacillus_1020A]